MIDRSKTREIPCWPMALTGRRLVWTSCRGNHFGQRSCATATRGRTYDCKRSDQNIIHLRGGSRPHMASRDLAQSAMAVLVLSDFML